MGSIIRIVDYHGSVGYNLPSLRRPGRWCHWCEPQPRLGFGLRSPAPQLHPVRELRRSKWLSIDIALPSTVCVYRAFESSSGSVEDKRPGPLSVRSVSNSQASFLHGGTCMAAMVCMAVVGFRLSLRELLLSLCFLFGFRESPNIARVYTYTSQRLCKAELCAARSRAGFP